MSDKILVVGGYGQVGRYTTFELINAFPKKVIVAGRNLEKADAFAAEHNNVFETMKLDIYDKESVNAGLKNIRVVVMCLSPKNTDFAEYCIKNGIHYIDVSPSNDVAKNIYQYKQEAESNHSTCILGVGLAPGLSNLLVKKLSQNADKIKKADISLLLGLGEKHGADGVKWFLDNIQRNFILKVDGTDKKFKPFIQKHKTVFPEPLGKRTAYRFNLADQFIVPQTLSVDNASSYYCYDSKFATASVSVLKRIGIFGLLKHRTFYNLFLKLFISTLSVTRKMKTGADIYGIQVDAEGIKNGQKIQFHIGTTGVNNSLITGQIVAFAATKLFAGNHPAGVFYLEELYSLDDLNDFGIKPKITLS
ncbi:MAG: saccharopine dehydrogenase NADP-binding domain-containing protein [Oscillospiraceae bacterium]|nr:saccharopine dehydrogenase NADP-binding domain-containing protein [Oscillospiraceae bacterium]